jgi:hypothetical protein
MARRYANGFWQPERVAQLKELFDGGMLISDIAYRMGVTKNMVSGRLWRSKMSRRDNGSASFESRMTRINKFPQNKGVCLFGIGNPEEDRFRFCGEPVQCGVSYCVNHAIKVYRQSVINEAGK